MLLFLLAYLGGVLTIVSPCILPVLPFVFARADRPFLGSGLPMLVGMAAYLTGVTHSPVTALVLLAEMTGESRGLAILIPSVGLAWLGSRLVLRHGLYHLLAERILARAGWNPSVTT